MSFVGGIVVGIAGVVVLCLSVLGLALCVAAKRGDRRRETDWPLPGSVHDAQLPGGVIVAEGDVRAPTVEWWCIICGSAGQTDRTTLLLARAHRCADLAGPDDRSRTII